MTQDLSMPRRRRQHIGALTVVGCLGFLALGAFIDGLLALLLMAVLEGFGVRADYWPCFGAILLANLLLANRRST